MPFGFEQELETDRIDMWLTIPSRKIVGNCIAVFFSLLRITSIIIRLFAHQNMKTVAEKIPLLTRSPHHEPGIEQPVEFASDLFGVLANFLLGEVNDRGASPIRCRVGCNLRFY